jgi:HK97 family phage portal protein
VATISYDLATTPIEVLARHTNDNGRDVVRPYYGTGIDSSGGIRSLAYMLMYQPNARQTATEFMLSLVPQFLLRERAYAEIVSGPTGFIEQLLPRHPDRIRVERLPSGRVRYRLTEGTGQYRYVTQEEMLTVQGLSLDGGFGVASRSDYGAQSIGTALAADRAAAKFFKSGMTAGVVATYTGQMEDEEEAALHASISRYATGVDNAFGLMLIPDDVKISNLSVEPDKAQMMAAREWGVLDVCRMFQIDPSKLMVKSAPANGSVNEQDEIRHVNNCLRPKAHLFEQAYQRDLILAKDTYYTEFYLDERLRGDLAGRAAYFTAALEGPWMWPSEIRAWENMNPDPALDALAKERYKPGTPRGTQPDDSESALGARRAGLSARLLLRGHLAVHDAAVRCCRQEREWVEKHAKKHASDVEAWQSGLRTFFEAHAGTIAERMRIDPITARFYAARRGAELEARGVVVYGDGWEQAEAVALAELALGGERAVA